MRINLLALLLVSLLLTQCRDLISSPKPPIDTPATQLSKVAHSQNVLLTTASYRGVLLRDTISILNRSLQEQRLSIRTPTPAEVIAAELILSRCTQQEQVRWYWRGLPHADTTQQHYEGAIYPLSYYRRQYRGFNTADGQRVLWINAFPKNPQSFLPDWKTREVSVEDGGKAYFSIYINLDTQQCFNFFRNSIGG